MRKQIIVLVALLGILPRGIIFATTHNIEALDAIINSCKTEIDKVRIVTLYKKQHKTVARILDGKEALELKDDLGLELR